MQRDVAITIRKGVSEDSRLLADLGRQTFDDSFARDNRAADMRVYLDASFNEEQQALELADPSSIFLIAEIGNETAGYARLRFETPPSFIRGRHPVHLQRIYTTQPWIGRGVGPLLMRSCIAEACRHRADGIWLGVWEQNRRALRFYAKWGFSKVGIQPFQLGSDRQTDQVLWRPLDIQPLADQECAGRESRCQP